MGQCGFCRKECKDEIICVETDCLAAHCSEECLLEHDKKYHNGVNLFIYEIKEEDEDESR